MGQCQAPETTQEKEQMGINCHLLIMKSIFVIYASVVILIGWVILGMGILCAFLADLLREGCLLILLSSSAFELKLTKECFTSMSDAVDGFVPNLKFALMRGMSSTKQQKNTLKETPSTSSLEEMSKKYSDL
jgi:hypothetical protein